MRSNPLLQSLGRQVRALRAKHGLTRKQLAERSELSTRFLVEVESGKGNISVRRLAALARALDTTPSMLLSGSDGQNEPSLVALLGLRGAGKTTVGRRLARRLRIPFVELDRRVEEASGLTLSEIFTLHGEQYYRRLEREALEQLLAEARPLVLSTGGGLVASPDTYSLLKRRTLTVWLRARPEDHWNRVVQQGDRRPMADHPQAMAELRRLLAVREPLYAEAAHTVDTSRMSLDQAVRAIESLTAMPQPAGRRQASFSRSARAKAR